MTRVLSAAVLAALVLATVWYLPAWVTVALAALIAAGAGAELAGLSAKLGAPVPRVFLGLTAAVVCAALALGDAAPPAGGALALVLLTMVVTAGALTLAAGRPDAATLQRAAIAFMAPVYLGLPLGAMAAVRVGHGAAVFTLLLVIVAVSDSAQYYAGRLFGRRPLAPAISRAKTVEGAIGGLVAAAAVGALVGPRWIAGTSPVVGGVLALAVALAGIIGDLFESLLKRSAGVKDSSALIPGHGGLLDRIDSYLFAAPLYYVFLRYF